MNPISLTAHTVGFTFGWIIFLINPNWNAGVVIVCMMSLSLIAALTVGFIRRNSFNKHVSRGAEDNFLSQLLHFDAAQAKHRLKRGFS